MKRLRCEPSRACFWYVASGCLARTTLDSGSQDGVEPVSPCRAAAVSAVCVVAAMSEVSSDAELNEMNPTRSVL